MAEEYETTVLKAPTWLDQARRAQSCLVVIYGRDLGSRHELTEGELTIGRGPDCVLQVHSDSVSRLHARVRFERGMHIVEDAGSTNGTFLNDQPIDQAGLCTGDLLRVGNTIFKFLRGGNVEALFHEEIYRMTIRDGLTGTYNQRYFLEVLDREVSRCARHQRPLSLAMLDIDQFRQVNDLHGYLAGDQVLKVIGETLSPRIRKEEVFARYGGEEFALLLPETNEAQATRFAERLRAAVEDLQIEYGGRSIHVTISLGVAELDAIVDPRGLLEVADRRLFEAKRAGRNRVKAG